MPPCYNRKQKVTVERMHRKTVEKAAAKQQEVSASSHVIVGGRKKGLRDARKYILIGAAVLIAAIIGAAFLLWGQPLKKSTSPTASKPAKSKLTDTQKASVKARSGDYAGGQKQLDESLGALADDKSKATVYLDKAALAYDAGKSDEALSYARQAEKLNPTRLSANVIAQVAVQKGDKKLALQYYRLALGRFTEEEKTMAQPDYEELQALIKGLE